MKLKTLNIIFALACGVLQTKADDVLTLQNATGICGQQAVLNVGMTNSDEVVALSFELTLPQGVTIHKDDTGFAASLVGARRPAGGYVVVGEPVDNTYFIAETSASLASFSGSTGDVLSITLDIDNSAAVGAQTISINNIELSKNDFTALNPAAATSTITLKNVSGTQTLAQLLSVTSPQAEDIPATGGKAFAEAVANYKYWTRTYYSDGTYFDGESKDSVLALHGNEVSANNLGETATERVVVGSSLAGGILPYSDVNGGTITATAAALDIYQAANEVTYDDVQISFTTGEDHITIPAGESYDLSKIIKATQSISYTSGSKGTADVNFCYKVVKSVEGFDALQLTDEAAIVSVQPTASVAIANGFTVGVVGVGDGKKASAAFVTFSAQEGSAVKAVIRKASDDVVYDLTGRIVPDGQKKANKSVVIVGNKKVIR